MNNNFITRINVEKLRHLENINIKLDSNKRKHLLLTGKNGVGKTTVLYAIKDSLRRIATDNIMKSKRLRDSLFLLKSSLKTEKDEKEKKIIEKQIEDNICRINKIDAHGLFISMKTNEEEMRGLYEVGDFILAYYGAKRATEVEIPRSVEKVILNNSYNLDENPSRMFVKYLVDLKTQQSFARNEEEMDVVKNIDKWFDKIEDAMKLILDDDSLKLKFDYRNYDFKILQTDREPYGFNELSDGYSAVLNIVSDLILRIDKNRAGTTNKYTFETEGIVLIDELETHLHIELQRKILPFLINFFPNIQFIVTTHSPFVLSSIENSVIFDLEKNIRLENLSEYSYEGIVEGYFEVDNYSNELREKLEKYKSLVYKNDLNDEERALRAEIRIDLKNSANDLAKELKSEFEEIEIRRKNKNGQN